MGKKVFSSVLPKPESISAAVVDQRREDAINATPLEYTMGHGYFIPRQKAHQIPVSYNGQTFQSKRVFAAECRQENGSWVPTGSFTAIKLNNINQTYFGEVKEGVEAPVINTYVDESGRTRMNTENVTFERAVKGQKGLSCAELTPRFLGGKMYLSTGLKYAYVPHFEDNALATDAEGHLQLDKQNIPTFEVVDCDANICNLSDLVDTKAEGYKDLEF